jgi:hypothetical protein
MAHCDSTAARSTVTMCYIAHKGGMCVHEASRLEQPVDSAVAETGNCTSPGKNEAKEDKNKSQLHKAIC